MATRKLTRGRPCGRKRGIAVDRLGLPWAVAVTSANTSDNEAGKLVVDRLRGKVPWLEVIAADHGYKVNFIEHVEQECGWRVEIAQKPESGQGFVPEKNGTGRPALAGRTGPPVRQFRLAQFPVTLIPGRGENRRKFGGHASNRLHVYLTQQISHTKFPNILLGLGPRGGPDWNGDIKKGPNDIGFTYSFIMPATGDRVPCVFVENQRVVALDPNDPIRVSFKDPVGNEPTGKDHPELLKVKPSHGHDFTIINGISRIGYMSGGKAARWTDENLAQVLTGKAVEFMDKNRASPFFLYFATHDIHVPRVPNQQFIRKSGLGPRGDVILQLDWTVGKILKTLDRLKLTDNTLVMLSSDNGAVIDDGYQDEAVEKLNGHRPSGPLRGGKYSAFEGGTRVPTIVRWPGRVKPGATDALVSQIDLLASFAKLTGQPVPPRQAPDSQDQLVVWLGETKTGRDHVIEHAVSGTLSLVKGNWKYIEPGQGVKLMKNSNTETAADPQPQLYDLTTDLAEQKNVAAGHLGKVFELKSLLEEVRKGAVAVK